MGHNGILFNKRDYAAAERFPVASGVVASTQVDRASPAWLGLRWSGSTVTLEERLKSISVGACREGDR